MPSIKTWVVSHDKHTSDIETTTIEAHSLTLEPSGALSFWIVSPDGMQSVLLAAYAPTQWSRVAIWARAKIEDVAEPASSP